jgi:phage shock protein PspC (stress-responsive transcriptional regulator)
VGAQTGPGLADDLDVDVVLIRAARLVFSRPATIIGGVIVYLAAWLIIPKPAGCVLATAPTSATSVL